MGYRATCDFGRYSVENGHNVSFLHFDSIPTKVTLNEYVEIAKVYSTSKSKDFINGILDKVMRELHDQGKINKSGRGLMD